jgi:rod shape-determining protein MreD
MDRAMFSSVWAYRALYVGLVVALLFLRLLPLGSIAGSWPGPDLVLCLTLAWVLRRPDYTAGADHRADDPARGSAADAPAGAVGRHHCAGDRVPAPPGALARELSFAVEWLLVAVVMAAAMLGFRLVLLLAMLPQVSLGQAMIQLIISILCYPVVVGASRLAFGVHKPATGEVDAYGRRL